MFSLIIIPLIPNPRAMKVLITGASGQLGSALCSMLAHDFQVIPATRVEFDITDLTTTRAFIRKTAPRVVVHPAAYTDVDGCETNKEKAFLVNAIGARNVAIATREIEAKLVFISTDYVFDGRKESPYLEYDPPNPLSIYGWSKLLGERLVMQHNPRSFILRISWLYGPQGKNFVETMLSLARTKDELCIVNDQHGTPTFVEDVARQVQTLIQTDSYGLYHATSQGSCTWYEFALEIFKYAGYKAEVDLNGSVHLVPKIQDLGFNTPPLRPITVRPVTTAQFPRPAKRPKNSVLENFMLKIQGLDVMPHWKESLRKFLNGYFGQGGRS